MDTVTGEHPPQTGREEIEVEHHEKKPVLKKVKDKMKKIKNAISKKSHGHGNDSDDADHHQGGDLDEGDDGFVEDDETMEDAEVHGAPMYESSDIRGRTGGKETSGGRGEGAEIVGDGLGSIVEDPYKPKTEAQHSRGGEDVEVSPNLSRSLESMTVSDRRETELSEDKSSSYTDMVSSAASKVYVMVADAGNAVISKLKPDARDDGDAEAVENQGKGISIKEYIAEKLTPGEDEKALSELITEAGQRKSNETMEVPRQEGLVSDDLGKGAGVVDRLKETVSALLGGGESSPKSPATEARTEVAEDNKDFHRRSPEAISHEKNLE